MATKIRIIESCLEAHGMNLAQFSEFSGIPRATFNTWSSKGEISEQGRMLLEKFIEVKQLKDELEDYRSLRNVMQKIIGN